MAGVGHGVALPARVRFLHQSWSPTPVQLRGPATSPCVKRMGVCIMTSNYKTLVVAGGTVIDVEPWRKALHKIDAGKAYALENRDEVAYTSNGFAIYIPSVICILNTYFMGRLTFVNTVPLTRRNLWIRDEGMCVYCGSEITSEEITFDHMIPQGQGGEETWTNIVCSCSPCNNRKDNRTPKQANMKLLKYPTVPRLNKKVVAKAVRKLGFGEPLNEEKWRGYWDVTLIS